MGGAEIQGHNDPDRLRAKGGKGRREYTREKRPPKERRSLIVDPYEMQMMEEYIDSLQSHNPYGAFALKQMAVQPWASAVITTRQNQVSEFATPRSTPFEMGFSIETRDPKKHPQPYERREMDRIRDLMMTCGHPMDNLYSTTADSFETFLRKITWDSLVFDASCFEVIPDKRGIPCRWVAVDASTIYKVAPKNEYGDYNKEDAAYVQIVDGQKRNWFSADEICFGIRRPRTDIKSGIYGFPELVELINVLTAMMFGWSYNMNFFRQGGPKGVLAVMGDMPEKNFRVFQRQLMYQAVSVKNAHRTVIVNPAGQGADLKWIPFTGANPSDIQFAEWVNANFRLLCSLMQIEPSEVGFYYQPEGGHSSPMFETSPEAKLKAGRDKGLRPLLRSVSYWLNRYIIWRINSDFEIRFLGLNTLSEMEQAQLDQMRIQTYLTPNELRAEKDLSDLGPEGDVVCNPVIVQLHQLAQAQEQIQQQAPPEVEAASEGEGMKPDDEPPEVEPKEPGATDEEKIEEAVVDEVVAGEKSLDGDHSHEGTSAVPAMNQLVEETASKPTEHLSEVFRKIEEKLKKQAG